MTKLIIRLVSLASALALGPTAQAQSYAITREDGVLVGGY